MTPLPSLGGQRGGRPGAGGVETGSSCGIPGVGTAVEAKKALAPPPEPGPSGEENSLILWDS